VRAYETLVSAGVSDPDVSFNLATAHAPLGRFGRAILWFERTLRQRPGDEGAEQGLAQARNALGRRRADASGEALVEARGSVMESLVAPFAEDTLAWSLLALDALFFALVLARMRARGETVRLALGIAAPLAGLALGLAVLGLAVKTGSFSDGAAAIVVDDDVAVVEGPDPRAGTRGRAHEGERARIVDRDGDWAHVHLGGGREGWVDGDAVGEI
jgi:tetratricopeptide (TPR) repeat protein